MLVARRSRRLMGTRFLLPNIERRAQHLLPLTDARMADSEPAQKHNLAQIPERRPSPRPAEHHEGNDVARQRGRIEDTVTALVELLVAVPAPTIALRRQVCPLGPRR
jgi:hypothetical protein